MGVRKHVVYFVDSFSVFRLHPSVGSNVFLGLDSDHQFVICGPGVGRMGGSSCLRGFFCVYSNTNILFLNPFLCPIGYVCGGFSSSFISSF